MYDRSKKQLSSSNIRPAESKTHGAQRNEEVERKGLEAIAEAQLAWFAFGAESKDVVMCRRRPHALTACYQIATEMKGPGLLGKNSPALPKTVYKTVAVD